MIRRIWLLIFWCASTGIFAQMPAGALVAFYSFNGCDRSDHTGLNEDIRMLGGVGCWCGIDQDGLLFSGSTDYALLDGPLSRYFSTSDLTVSFYLRVWPDQLFRQVIFSTYEPDRSPAGWEAIYDPVDGVVTFHLMQDSIRRMIPLEVPLDTGKWHHLTLVRDGAITKGYHNGRLIHQVRRCRNVDISNTSPLYIARPAGRAGPLRFPLKGMVDELRVYSIPLSDDEVLDLYNRHPVEEAQWDCYSAERPPGRSE
ncbi:MAG: LamG domain-containing protein [Saprospiraceae bacterium]|nr:LamG domain-containing protein [Saprospiraceae bacterium]